MFRFAGAVAAALMPMSLAVAAEIEPYGRGTFADIRQAHAGHPLIVHFWSVTCIPCLTEMPRLAAFAREHKDIDLVLVSTDAIAQRERILSRLEKFGFADRGGFAFADSFEERLHFEADRTWRGELPFTVFVTTGGATTSVAGELDPAMVSRWSGDAAVVR